MRFPGKLGMCPSLAEPDSDGFPRSNFEMFPVKHFVATVPPEQLQDTCFPFQFHKAGRSCSPASKSCRFSHHPLRVPKAWHRDFAACGQRSGLLALNLASIFEKLLDQKTFVCLRLVIGNIFLRETSRIRFGKAGAHPQLAFGIAIAPETLHSHYNLSILKAIAILPILS